MYFPIWFWVLVSVTVPLPYGVYALAAALVCSTLAVLFAVLIFRVPNKGRVIVKSFWKVFLFTALSDYLGAAAILGVYALCQALLPSLDVASAPGSVFVAIPGVIVAGVLIWLSSRFVSFRNTGSEAKTLRRLSLMTAILLAPYWLAIPVPV